MIPPDSDTMLTAAISTSTTTLIYIIISCSIMKATELSSSLIRLLQTKSPEASLPTVALESSSYAEGEREKQRELGYFSTKVIQ